MDTLSSRVFFRPTFLFYAVLLCCASLSFAEKTDRVVLKNGNEIAGEIRRMDQGRLTYRTDAMKTVYIDWTNILRISSKRTLDILMKSGVRYQGSLQDAGQDGKVVIVTETGQITADIQSLVIIVPLEGRLWKRFKGAISAGFDLQKAKTQRTFTMRSNVTYHGYKWALNLHGDNYINTREDADRISRNSVILSYERFTSQVWSILGYINIEHNDELSLDLRSSLGAGIGRFFVKNNVLEFTGIVFLNANNEKYAETEDPQQNLEAGFGLSFKAFRYHEPDLDVLVDLKVLPNLTDWGRVRINFTAGIDYEVFKNFYISLHFFDRFDSRPPSYATISKNDYGTDISITWKLK